MTDNIDFGKNNITGKRPDGSRQDFLRLLGRMFRRDGKELLYKSSLKIKIFLTI